MTQASKRIPRTPKAAARRRAALDRALDPELFKALGDPTRVRLLSCLARCRRACTVSEVAACCEVDFSVVSRHLASLARAGVLEAEKKGRTVYYRARCAALAARLRALAEAVEECCPTEGAGGCAGSGGACRGSG